MDLKQSSDKLTALLKKYKYVVIILAIGITLMLLPTSKAVQTTPDLPTSEKNAFCDPTEDLTRILRQIQGAGDVQVLLTVAAGEKTVYQTNSQTDADGSSESIRLETVIVTDSDRTQQGLVTQIMAPQYRGAVVVCRGADDPTVKLAIMEAVKNATGLSFDRISVLKMK